LIDPGPCPLGVDMSETHDALLDADHVQSRFVVTFNVLVAPAAGMVPDMAFATLTSHFADVGELTLIEVGPPVQAVARRSSAHAPNSRARIASRRSASALPSRAVL